PKQLLETKAAAYNSDVVRATREPQAGGVGQGLTSNQLDVGCGVKVSLFAQGHVVSGRVKSKFGGRELTRLFTINQNPGADRRGVDSQVSLQRSKLHVQGGAVAAGNFDHACFAGVAILAQCDPVNRGGERAECLRGSP